jgi:predicted HTH domain antitoxin
VKAIQIEYPESWAAVSNSSAEAFEGELRMALAVKLFEVGRLTSGQAARLANVPRITFLLSCPRWGVPAVAWDSAELEAEFKPLGT